MNSIEELYDLNFLEYASYVIKDRAIPHIDDGLKPVQRRIMHSLFELDDGKFHKVANVVGHSMKYHPHGDASIYSALVVIANKEIFIDKQGNYGNIYTGDPASAARYIECRSSKLGKSILYNPEVTEFVDSYDGRNKEPVVFPAKIPVLLAQGTEGIAVGMATKILPHNLIELLKAQILYLKDKKFELIPDFPAGGYIDASDYDDGKGKVLSRAKIDASDPKKVVIREIPFGMTTEALMDSIESAAKKGKIKISSINDYTAEHVEIEIKLMRGVRSEDVIDALYAFTDCEVSISSNITVIKDNKPIQLTASEVLKHNTNRLVTILKAELDVEAGKLQDRLHSKTLEQIFIENRIYKKIEEMKTSKAVKEAVYNGLKPFQKEIKREVTDEDIETLLRIPIRRISLYDINKAKKEMREIRSRLREIKKSLAEITEFTIAYISNLIEEQKDNYKRKTEIVSISKVDVREVAKRDLKLRYDKKTGYLGYKCTGDLIVDISPYDRVLVIKKDASYSVIDAPEKIFVGKGLLYCGFIEKDLVFNMIYKHKKTNIPYIKRCTIEKFILNKVYELLPPDCNVVSFQYGEEKDISLEYKPKERTRLTKQSFAISDFPIRGLKAGGLKLSNRELKSGKFIKPINPEKESPS
ncbi:MAG: DNA topoisomerase IV subunit A [Planctomycetes bacterium]|nr:DNA topoisomerase IV subunit A [Planctomycetota bacterium]